MAKRPAPVASVRNTKTTNNRPAWFVYCTATNGTEFVEWEDGRNDLPMKKHSVIINGGSGIVQKKSLITRLGVKTDVTQDQMDFLNNNDEFKRMKKDGWITVIKATGWQDDPDSVAANMAQRDGSSPVVPNDYNDEKQPKVGNDKGFSYTTLPRHRAAISNQFR